MKDYWPIALENVGITLCFLIAAIFFNHWWIILFALFGWTSIKRPTQVKEDDPRTT